MKLKIISLYLENSPTCPHPLERARVFLFSKFLAYLYCAYYIFETSPLGNLNHYIEYPGVLYQNEHASFYPKNGILRAYRQNLSFKVTEESKGCETLIIRWDLFRKSSSQDLSFMKNEKWIFSTKLTKQDLIYALN